MLCRLNMIVNRDNTLEVTPFKKEIKTYDDFGYELLLSEKY